LLGPAIRSCCLCELELCAPIRTAQAVGHAEFAVRKRILRLRHCMLLARRYASSTRVAASCSFSWCKINAVGRLSVGCGSWPASMELDTTFEGLLCLRHYSQIV